MIAALLTVLLFALSAICGRRVTEMMDSLCANAIRLVLAAAALGLLAALTAPAITPRPALLWLLLSGVVGFGIGDAGLFLAYPRIGSRLTVLIYLCLAPLFAAAGEWLWLGQTLTLPESFVLALILFGVAFALSGPIHLREHRSTFLAGSLWAVVAGLGQGFGGVLSRQAELAANDLGASVPALQQAFQRCLGGLGFALLLLLAVRFSLPPAQRRVWTAGRPHPLTFTLWLTAAALFGPVFGVTCFQWALLEIGNSAIVQAMVSTTPIALIPLAWRLEKDRPTGRSIAGSLVAVAGVVLLCLLQGQALA